MIIGFTGKKKSGKTEAAKALSEFTKINFKDALIDEIKDGFPDLLNLMSVINGISLDDLFIKKPLMVRLLMQNYGTDVKRKKDKFYWVNAWGSKVVDSSGNIVADDVRFLNEAELIQKMGGKIIRIIRDNVEVNDKHISEIEMDKIKPDYEIVNNGTKDDLYKDVKKILKKINE